MQRHFRVWLHSLTEGRQDQQKKIWKQREEKNFKEETFISLSPRSQYYCFNHSRASRIQKFFLVGLYFTVFRGPSTLKSFSPPL